MNERTKAIGALALIIVGLAAAIILFNLFLKQKNLIERERQKAEELKNLYEKEKNKSDSISTELAIKLAALDSIYGEQAQAQLKIQENNKFHVGISYPSMRNAESTAFIAELVNKGFNIWYQNEKLGDLGNMYYYGNNEAKAKEIKELLVSIDNRFERIKISPGGSSGGKGEKTIILKI